MSDLKDKIRFIPPSGEAEKLEMLDFVNEHFVPLEPLNKACDICQPGYRMAWFDNFVGDYISEGYSLMAIDSESGQMVGLAIFTKCKKGGDQNVKDDNSLARWQVCPKKFGKILDFLGGICEQAGDLFEMYDVQEYLEMFILCTHSGRSYPGLGTLLAEEALDRAKNEWNFRLVVTEATSFYSQKIFSKLGFQVLREVDFEDYRDSESGEIVFPKFGPHKTVQLMTKKL